MRKNQMLKDQELYDTLLSREDLLNDVDETRAFYK